MQNGWVIVRDLGIWLRGAFEPAVDFLGENVGPVFTLLGALIALLTAWFVHFDRVRRERNDRIRKLLGEYVAAVHAVEDAQVILRARESERKGSGFDPMEVVRTLKGQPEDPVRAAMTARVRDAKDELQRAETRVRSLFFQLSIVKGQGEEDLIFAIKLLGAARSEAEYLNAYNFALAVAMRYYGDGRQERRSGKKSLKSYQSIAKRQWEQHIAERDAQKEPTTA